MLDRCPPNSLQPFEYARQLTDLLTGEYGLPRAVARAYAAALLPKSTQTSTAQWFGL